MLTFSAVSQIYLQTPESPKIAVISTQTEKITENETELESLEQSFENYQVFFTSNGNYGKIEELKKQFEVQKPSGEECMVWLHFNLKINILGFKLVCGDKFFGQALPEGLKKTFHEKFTEKIAEKLKGVSGENICRDFFMAIHEIKVLMTDEFIANETLWYHVVRYSLGEWKDTDQCMSYLSNLTPEYFVEKVNEKGDNTEVLSKIFGSLNNANRSDFISSVMTVLSECWAKGDAYPGTVYIEEGSPSDGYQYAISNGRHTGNNEFEFSHDYYCKNHLGYKYDCDTQSPGSAGPIYDHSHFTGHFTAKPCDPIVSPIGEDCIVLPAFLVQTFIEERNSSFKNEFLSLSVGYLLPEAFIRPLTLSKWGQVLSKAKNAVKKVGLDFSKMDIPSALQHVKFRDLSNLKLREISGCHDAVEFAKLRTTKAISNPSYTVTIGKTLDEVEEIIILAEKNHTTIPGVKTIEYRVPATDGKFTQKINGIDVNKGYTTGKLTGNGSKNYTKTIYDPAVWTDAKLEKALKEALQDVANKNGTFVNGKSYRGVTIDGYEIEFWYRDNNIQTFYFYDN